MLADEVSFSVIKFTDAVHFVFKKRTLVFTTVNPSKYSMTWSLIILVCSFVSAFLINFNAILAATLLESAFETTNFLFLMLIGLKSLQLTFSIESVILQASLIGEFLASDFPVAVHFVFVVELPNILSLIRVDFPTFVCD